MPNESQPWDRLPAESSRAFAAFAIYRDLGPSRSVDTAWRGQQTGVRSAARAPGHWTRWSQRHEWRSRAEAFDAHLDRQRQAELIRRRKARESIAFDQLSGMADDMAWYVRERCLKLPPVDMVRNVTDADGAVVPTHIKGLNPTSTANLARAVAEINGVLVNGHVKLTGKLPEPDQAQPSGPFQFIEGIPNTEENA